MNASLFWQIDMVVDAFFLREIYETVQVEGSGTKNDDLGQRFVGSRTKKS